MLFRRGQIVTATSMQINRGAAAISLSSVCEVAAECGTEVTSRIVLAEIARNETEETAP